MVVVVTLNLISTTDAAAADNDIWNCVALRRLGNKMLDLEAVVDEVELHDVWLWLDVVHLEEKVLGLLGVWAVGLREDNDWLVVLAYAFQIEQW